MVKRDFKAIRQPAHYFGILRNGNSNHQKVTLSFKINIHDGALDYKLEKLKEIDNLLSRNSAEIFLYPHRFQKGNALLGIIQCPQVGGINEILGKVKRIAKKSCRFHKDRMRENSERFWREHFNKMENALGKAISENEISQMYLYLDSLVRVVESVEQARKGEAVRKTNDRLDKCWDLIDLYRKSLRQILLGSKQLEHQEKASNFTNLLIASLHKQVEQMLESGDWATLKLVTMLIPRMYTEYKICDVNEDNMSWGSRARFGSFYAWANGLFEEHCGRVDEEEQEKMRIVLHEGVTKWLKIGLEMGDHDLAHSLCSAAREIAFEGSGINLKHKELACQHLILLGKMLHRYLKDEGVEYDDVKNLISEPLERGLKIDFEELTLFYLEHQVPHETHREYLRLFVNYVSEGRTDPLRGISSGSGYSMGLGGYEMALSFIYMGSLALQLGGEAEVRAINFLSGHLKEAISEMQTKMSTPGFFRLRVGFEKFKTWVEKCSEMHKQKDAQKIAGTKIGEETAKNYDDGFQEGITESIPFVDYCVKKGYIQLSDTASMKPKWHMPKEWFMEESRDDIVKKGKSFGSEIGNDANTWIVRELIDYEDEEDVIEEDSSMTLIHNVEARKKASKEVQKAVDWLKNTGCSIEEGIIILRGVGADVLHLFEESTYQPAWREEGMERGFEGYYHGYPVLHLWDAKRRPLCAAMDLRGWNGLIVRSELANEKKAGKVLRIRDRIEEEIHKAIEKGSQEILRAQGYCVVEMELFWKMPKEKPKQKVFVYELPSPELPQQENHNSGLQIKMGEVKQVRTEKKKEEGNKDKSGKR